MTWVAEYYQGRHNDIAAQDNTALVKVRNNVCIASYKSRHEAGVPVIPEKIITNRNTNTNTNMMLAISGNISQPEIHVETQLLQTIVVVLAISMVNRG
jgi:hypothetical protein